MLTLFEMANRSTTQFQQGVVEEFGRVSPVLATASYKEITGSAVGVRTESELPQVEWRAVNAPYSESTGKVVPSSERLSILGGTYGVDRFIEQTASGDAADDQFALETLMKIKSVNYKLSKDFIHGSVADDANAINGLAVRVAANGNSTAFAANGAPILGASDADMHNFFDALDALIASTRGNRNDVVLYMSDLALARVRSAARRLGRWSQTVADFGRSIDTYDGVRLVGVGQDAAGEDILPANETEGSETEATSIYAVKWGEANGGLEIITNGGIQALEWRDQGIWRMGMIETYLGLAEFGPKAIARLSGLTV